MPKDSMLSPQGFSSAQHKSSDSKIEAMDDETTCSTREEFVALAEKATCETITSKEPKGIE